MCGGRPQSQPPTKKKLGNMLTHIPAAYKSTRCSKQEAPRAETSKALLAMLSLGSRASSRGRASSLIAMVVEQNLSQTVASEPSYEDSLQETEKELSKVEAQTSFKRQSLILRSLCFILCVVFLSFTWYSQSFQLHSLQQKELAGSSWIAESSLQQKELAKTAAKSLQHQELVKLPAQSLQHTELASFWVTAFKRSPTRASQLTLQSFQLHIAQLCQPAFAHKSLQQNELDVAYLTGQTKARELNIAQLCGPSEAQESLQQHELAAAYAFKAQYLGPTRARQALQVAGDLRRPESIHYLRRAF